MSFRVSCCAFLVALAGCSGGPEFNSPAGYDFATPEKILMKENLLEISGIAFNLQRSDTVFSVNDEEGRLYKAPLGGKGLQHTRFGPNGDYEDIAIVRERIYILRSDGAIFTFPLINTLTNTSIDPIVHHLLPKGEYEGLYAHEAEQKLYVLCKRCGKEKNILAGQSIRILPDSLILAEPFRVTIPDNTSKAGKSLQPSALAYNTTTREWFIVSSVHKKLWVTDSLWNLRNTYILDPRIFIQPEGITFDRQQNLYISNEGNEIHNGSILKFSFHPN